MMTITYILLYTVDAFGNGIIMVYVLIIATDICKRTYSKTIQSNPW